MTTYTEDFSGTFGTTPTNWTNQTNSSPQQSLVKTTSTGTEGDAYVDWENNGQSINGLQVFEFDTPGSLSLGTDAPIEVLVKHWIKTGASIDIIPIALFTDGDAGNTSGYAIKVDWGGAAYGQVDLVEYLSGGINAVLGTDSTSTIPSEGAWWWFWIKVDGSSNFEVKFWQDGNSRPGTANITATDTTITSGFVGIGRFSFHEVQRWDYLVVGTGGDQALMPGESAGDTTAPTYSVNPALNSKTATSITVDATASDETDASVNHYAVAVANGAAAPSPAQIAAGQDSTGSAALASGSDLAVTNGVEGSIVLSGLTASTNYDIYYTVGDSSSNYAAAQKLDVKTKAEVSSASIAADGLTVTINFTEAMTTGAGGSGGFALSSGETLTYSSGDSTSSVEFTASDAIEKGASPTLEYTQPGDGWQTLSLEWLDSFSGQEITNNSNWGPGATVIPMYYRILLGGN